MDNNEAIGFNSFPENEHLVAADLEILDKFAKLNWGQLLRCMKQMFRDYDKSLLRWKKSGEHSKCFFGDGFCKGDLAVYYFYLNLQNKPNAHGSVTSLLDEDFFFSSAEGYEKVQKKQKREEQDDKEKKQLKETMSEVLSGVFEAQIRADEEKENRRIRQQGIIDAKNDSIWAQKDAQKFTILVLL